MGAEGSVNREFVVRADTTARADVSGTAFAHLDVRWLVGEARDRAPSSSASVRRSIRRNGGTHEHHRHPDAEEIVIVLSGHGWHRVGDQIYDIAPATSCTCPATRPLGVLHQ